MQGLSFVQAQTPMTALAVIVVHRAFATRDDDDVMLAGMLVQEYAMIWRAMRHAAKMQERATASGMFGGW